MYQGSLAHIQQLQPNLIVISGDFLNLSYVHDATARAEVQKLLHQIQAPHGVYAVLGSPTVDDRQTVPPLLQEMALRLLRDEWVSVNLGDGRQLDILGMDCSHELGPDGEKLAGLVQKPGFSKKPGFSMPSCSFSTTPPN